MFGTVAAHCFELSSLYHILDRHIRVLPFSSSSPNLPDEPKEFLIGKGVLGNWWMEKKEAKKRIKVMMKAMYSFIAFWRNL